MRKLFIQCFISMFFILLSTSTQADIVSEHDTVVVTATRIDEFNYKLASNVTVISKEQIKASTAQSVPDLLKEAVGAFVYDNSTVKTSTVDIRGFGDSSSRNVLVLINGRRINTVDLKGADLAQISKDSIERIEIVRGAGSVFYGDNAVGGVINIITKKGEGDFKGTVGGTYGSYDRNSSQMEVSGEHKDISYYVHSKYFDDRGYRDNSDVLSKDFNTRLAYKLTDKISADLEVGVHDDKYRLPGGLDEAELVTLGRRGSADPANIATTKDKYWKMTLDADPWPEDVYYGHFVVDYTLRDRQVFDSFGGFDTDRDIRTDGITGKYIFNRTIFDHEVDFVLGTDYYKSVNDIVGSGFNTDDLTITKEDIGFFGFLQFELLEDLFVNGGTRYYEAEYTFDDRGSAVYESKMPDQWVSMAGLKYEYAEGSNVHMNAQQTFRFPVTDEFYGTFSGLNTDLDEQTGVQYEMGVKHNFNNVSVVTLTPYFIQTKDEIFFDPNSGFFGANSNYDKIRRYGMEFTNRLDLHRVFDVEMLDTLEFLTNYTWQRPEFYEGANDGFDVPMAPRHQAGAGIVTGFFDHIQASLIGRYVGSRFIINDTLNAMPEAKPYYSLDAKLAYKLEYLEIFAGLNNITNQKYAPYQIKKTATTRDVYPAPEFNYNFGVNINF